MEYLRLGRSGLEVSRVVLGCMSFGDGGQGSWTLGLDEARPFVRRALEAGITTFDTANRYGSGRSEEIAGKLLGELADRDDVVIATKVFFPMGRGPKAAGLSRGAIFAQVEQSLRRLGTDYIDLYQIHRHDPEVPIEETMQDQYNLIMREEEREMLPFCLDQGVGVLPYSPLARGRLARDPDTSTVRSEHDAFARLRYQQAVESDRKILEAVGDIARARGVPRAQVALAWVLRHAAVTAPIIGVTREHHITDAVAATGLELTADEVGRLDEHYVPRAPEGF